MLWYDWDISLCKERQTSQIRLLKLGFPALDIGNITCYLGLPDMKGCDMHCMLHQVLMDCGMARTKWMVENTLNFLKKASVMRKLRN
jgi:hypothetical protein